MKTSLAKKIKATILTISALVLCFANTVLAEGETAAASTGSSSFLSKYGMIIYIVVIVAFMYFLIIRPNKKQKKEQEALMASMAIGDTVLTTAGFYGEIIDLTDDTVIVEFGNNKNCRIPMQRGAIVQIEKPNYSNSSSDTTEE